MRIEPDDAAHVLRDQPHPPAALRACERRGQQPTLDADLLHNAARLTPDHQLHVVLKRVHGRPGATRAGRRGLNDHGSSMADA